MSRPRLSIMTVCVCLMLMASAVVAVGCGTSAVESSSTSAPKAAGRPQPVELHSNVARASAAEASAEEMAILVADSQAFALDLLTRLSHEGSNLVFSPWGLLTALSMTHDGARGVTQQEIAAALHLSLPSERVPVAVNTIDLTLNSTSMDDASTSADGDSPEFHSATAFWAQTGEPFHQEYLDLLARYYGSGITTLDFNGDREGAGRVVAEWLAQEIGREFSSGWAPPVSQVWPLLCVLTSAVRLDALWEHQFDPAMTRPRPFTLDDGTEITVDTMSVSSDFLVAEGEDYQAVELPYAGNALTFLAILPTDPPAATPSAGGNLTVFEEGLTPTKLAAIIDGLAGEGLTTVSLPKFDFQRNLDLEPTLTAMGMATAFKQGDFSGMTPTVSWSIDGVAQQAYIEVTEQGTKAGAATEVTIAAGIGGSLELNRPFLFLIRHVPSGALLFVGEVRDPRSAGQQ
ncbi:MAG: serpin family protein [Actinobacteria bacterium]|nr:serpin family protein [Actinomycetota bacterium]